MHGVSCDVLHGGEHIVRGHRRAVGEGGTLAERDGPYRCIVVGLGVAGELQGGLGGTCDDEGFVDRVQGCPRRGRHRLGNVEVLARAADGCDAQRVQRLPVCLAFRRSLRIRGRGAGRDDWGGSRDGGGGGDELEEVSTVHE